LNGSRRTIIGGIEVGMKTIVVGVDGSQQGEAALGFAAEEAGLRGGRLVVVCAWEIPMMIEPVGAYPGDQFKSMSDEAESVVQAAVARVAELEPSVVCEGKAIEGRAASVLLRESEHADMVVVGSRGRGGFASLLLGSVSQQVVHHASCPVVVVR
jgi:nucleotide-binding universal stress UspA family protein